MSASQIPLSITRADVVALCQKLGFDAEYVESMEFGYRGIYVTAHALGADGRRLADGSELARHRIFVPILDEEAIDDDSASGRE